MAMAADAPGMPCRSRMAMTASSSGSSPGPTLPRTGNLGGGPCGDGVSAAAVYVPDKGNLYRSGIEVPDLDVDQLKSIIARGEPMVDSARNLSYTPLKMGVRTVGAIGVAGNLSRPGAWQ